MRTVALMLLLAAPAIAEESRTIVIVPSKSLPKFETVTIYRSADLAAGRPKAKPLATLKLQKAELQWTAGAEAVHVFAKPKDGIDVPLALNRVLKSGERLELKLDAAFGVIEVFQKDDFVKVDRIVLTAPDDPGPDEKGHSPVQVGSDYRVEMPVPEGFYAVWLVPANGARATRIEDRVRVLPGKIVRIGN